MRAFRNAGLAWMMVLALTLDTSGSSVFGQEWTRFRGPNGTGISTAKTVPISWTEKDYNWKTKLPAGGHSSPVLWGDTIFLSGADDNSAERFVFALSAKDGKILWSRSFASAFHKKHKLNSFASPSAACDAELVYFSWSTPEEYTLLSLTHDNKPKWKRNLGSFSSQHSAGVSPILVGDLLILWNGQDKENNGQSSVMAFNKSTGETVWQLPRTSTIVPYSTPCVRKNAAGEDELICNESTQGIVAINPKNGKINWEIPSLIDKRSCSSPVITTNGLITISCGSGGGGNFLVAVHPKDQVDSKAGTVEFKVDRIAPYVPTPIAYGDYLFMMADMGIAICVNVKTGATEWKERVGGDGAYYSSLVCIDGKLYCTSSSGSVAVLAASNKYELLATNSLGETCHSTPAVANGRLYIRTVNHLISIGGDKTKLAAK